MHISSILVSRSDQFLSLENWVCCSILTFSSQIFFSLYVLFCESKGLEKSYTVVTLSSWQHMLWLVAALTTVMLSTEAFHACVNCSVFKSLTGLLLTEIGTCIKYPSLEFYTGSLLNTQMLSYGVS